MGKRIHAFNTSTGIDGSYRVPIDLPGWSEPQYRTLTQLQTFFTGHNAVTIGTANGLSLGAGANAQRLSLAIFSASGAGACPAKPTAPLSNGYAGHFLNANGDWVQLFEPPLPDATIGVLKPLNDIDYVGVGEAGKFAFNVTDVEPEGTAHFYSGTANKIKTDNILVLGGGDGLKKIEGPATATMTATGDYIAVTLDVSGVETVVYLPTFETLP